MPRPVRTPALLTLALLLMGLLPVTTLAQEHPYLSGYTNPLPILYVRPVTVTVDLYSAEFVTTLLDIALPRNDIDPFGEVSLTGHSTRSTAVVDDDKTPEWWYQTEFTHELITHGSSVVLQLEFWDDDDGFELGDDYLGAVTYPYEFGKWDQALTGGASITDWITGGEEQVWRDTCGAGCLVTSSVSGEISIDPLTVDLVGDRAWDAGLALVLDDRGRAAYREVTVGNGGTLSTNGAHGITVDAGGLLSIQEGGVVTAADGVVGVGVGGKLRMESGGTLRAGKGFYDWGGQFEWVGGTLQVAANSELEGYEPYTTINSFNPFGIEGDFAISGDRTLQVDDELWIGTDGGLIVNEGRLDARDDIVVLGYLSVKQGPGGLLGEDASFGLAPGKTAWFWGGLGYFEGHHEFDGDIRLEASDGGELRFDEGFAMRSATIEVAGADSKLQTGALGPEGLWWGTGADTANVIFSGGAQGELNGDLHLGALAFDGDTGIMSVESGADVTVNSLSIGAYANVAGSGKLTVTGEGSTLLQNFGAFNLLVGGGASTAGEVHVNDGGLLRTGSEESVVSSTGSITVDGGTLNSRGNLRIVGGALDVLAGSLTFNPGKALLFEQGAEGAIATNLNFSDGQALLVYGGSYLELRGLDLGQAGNGTTNTLNVYGANTVFTTSAPQEWGLGGGTANALFSDQAEAYFDGDLNLATTSVVGTTASLQISTGATVSARSIQLASFTQGEATLTISGAGSTLTQESDSTLTVGGSGASTATVNIYGGGELHTGTGATTVNPTGVVTVDDGVFNASGDVNIEGGSVALTHDGSQLYAETVRLNSGAFTFDGGALGVDRFEGNLTNNGGKISPGRPTPGDTTGLTMIAGDLTNNSGTLVIELGGIERGTEYDSVSVTGDVDLSASLDLSLVDGFELRPGQVFTILEVDGSLTGGLLGLPEGSQVGTFNEEPLWVTYINGDNIGAGVTLFTRAPLSGDYNGDGLVDGLDYDVWRDTYGSLTLPIYGADGNGDGVINAADYTVWRDHIEAASATAGVPEPSALVLAVAIMSCYAGRRRRVG